MFSVLIPVYNHARFLASAVVSALRAPLVGEILIVDDGSTDDCREIVERLSRSCGPRVRSLNGPSAENLGAPERLNQLVRAARFEWLAILNSDDQFTPGRFEAVRAAICRRAADLYFGNILIIDKDGRITGRKRPFFDYEYEPDRRIGKLPIGREALIALLANQNIIATTSNAIFTRTLFEKVGGFSSFRYVHDWDFFLRAAWHGTAHYVPQPLVLYRQHGANTIAESGKDLKKEAQKLFSRILADIPDMETRRSVAIGLGSNQYLQPYRAMSPGPVPITLQLSQLMIAKYWPVGAPPAWVRSGGSPSIGDHANRAYFYEPDDASSALSLSQIENALLALSAQSLDFVVISHSLASPAAAPVGTLRNACLVNDAARPLLEASGWLTRSLHGRLMRLLPGPNHAQFGRPIGAHIAGAEVATDGLVEINASAGSRAPQPRYLVPLALSLPRQTQKMRVLVFPVFMAVGGVERHAIEVMRALGACYDFCVVTFERLTEQQGSLHHQLQSLGIAFFELGEIADQSQHLRLVDCIASQFAPDLIWICNGSPWLLRNAANLRRRFANIPIVDQQVYDTEVGWVNYYDDPGIRSFDRFVAINAKISEAFNDRFNIPKDSVDLIRHGIDTEEFDGALVSHQDRCLIRQEFGVDANDRCFALIGRLTDQKDPLRYLAIAEGALKAKIQASFLLVGDGDLAGEVDRLIAARGLVNLRRIMYYPRPKRIYQAIDGLILTSKYEGLPIVCLEALAQGLPILATDVGDLAWAIANFGAGDVVSADINAPRIFAAFQKWNESLDNHTLEARRRSASARQEFSIKRCAAQYDACWRRAVEDKTPQFAVERDIAEIRRRSISV